MKRSRLIWFIFAMLIALNAVVGGLAYRYLGRVDANYTKLLTEGIPFLNAMQTVTAQASRSIVVLVDITQAQTPAELARLETELRKIREVSNKIFGDALYERAVPEELMKEYQELRVLRLQSQERRDQFFALARSQRFAEAGAYLRSDIYPAYKHYIGKLDAFCDLYQESFARLNRQLSEESTKSQSLVFGLSALPAALTGAVLFLSGVVLAVIAILYRRYGSGQET